MYIFVLLRDPNETFLYASVKTCNCSLAASLVYYSRRACVGDKGINGGSRWYLGDKFTNNVGGES